MGIGWQTVVEGEFSFQKLTNPDQGYLWTKGKVDAQRFNVK